MIHVYGFVAAPSTAPRIAGLGGAPVETYVVGSVAAVVSRHPDGPAATEEAIVRHAQVVEAAMRSSGAVLPARFGARYADESALGRAVGARAATLRDRLARVGGCVELGVRVLGAFDDHGEPAADGTAYLRARLRERSERAWLAAWAHEPLSDLARESTHRVPHSGRVVLIGSYLVSEGGREEFERRVERLRDERPGLDIVLTGPWPPYSFAEPA